MFYSMAALFPQRHGCLIRLQLPVMVASGAPTFVVFKSDGCAGSADEVTTLEHVQVTLHLTYHRRGALDIYLKSPAGK